MPITSESRPHIKPAMAIENITRALYEISTAHQLGFRSQVMKLLKLGCEYYDMEIGILSEIKSNEYSVRYVRCPHDIKIRSGDTFDLNETLCAEVLSSGHHLAIENIQKSVFDLHLASNLFSIKSYIGVPVRSNGRICGTLNYSSRSLSPGKFSELHLDIIEQMSVLVGSELDRLDKRKKLETAFRSTEVLNERLRLTVEASPTAMITTNYDGLIIHVNEAAEKLFEYSKNELIDRSVDVLVPKNIRSEHAKQRQGFARKPRERPMGIGREFYAIKKSGERFQVEIGLRPVDGPQGKNIICSVVDLTLRKEHEETILRQSQELKAANDKLSELATTDGLTGLANRRYFIERLEQQLLLANRNGTPLSVVMLDVDNFKKYNDCYGHQAGDGILQQVSASLTQVARGSDVAARYGGEEFVIVLPNTDETGSITIAERCRQEIANQSSVDGNLTASFGATTVHPSGQNTLDVKSLVHATMKAADEAMYHSKNAGKNRVTHFNGLDRAS